MRCQVQTWFGFSLKLLVGKLRQEVKFGQSSMEVNHRVTSDSLFLETCKAHVHTCSSGETSDAGLLEVGAFDLYPHFKVSISSKVRALEVSTFTYLSHGCKLCTYEYLPDIFRTATMMIPAMDPMPSKTPTVIPIMVPVEKPSE